MNPNEKKYIVKNAENIDTARPTTYMTEREKNMIQEVNLIRSNPAGYIPYVEQYIQQKETEKTSVMMGADWIQDEIDTAYELIEELKNTPSRSILQPYEKLHQAAKMDGDEGKAQGSLGHQGADGSWPWDRIKKADPTLLNGGENLVGGPSDVRESVMALLVDSGIPNRGHRKNILNPDWKYIACYEVGTVVDMPFYWVQKFAAPVQQTATVITTSSGGNDGFTTIENFGDFGNFGDLKGFEGFEGFENMEGFTQVNTGEATVVENTAPVAEAPTGDVSEEDLDTAKNAAYLSDREKAMIKEINLVRSNPVGYIPIIENYIKEQEAEMSQVISGADWMQDDINTAKELIEELKNTPRLSILKPHEGVYGAAKKHGDEGKAKGSLDHQGADGSWPWDRILWAVPDLHDGNENLVGGPSDVRTSVILLLVDSGIPNRGHRKTLLNPAWKFCACYEVGDVADMPYYWVQKFAW